jgi:hypothetical protein
MSKILLNPINSFPIEIPYKNLNKDLIYSLSNDNFDTLFYFKLILKINNKETVFINSGKKNFSNIIKYSKQIKYDQINNFEIQINYFGNTYFLNDIITNQSSSFVKQENNIFIEFSQDSNGFTNCICYFIEDDLSTLCISPPN